MAGAILFTVYAESVFVGGVGECFGNTTPEFNSVTKIAMANYSERRQNVYYLTNTWKRI